MGREMICLTDGAQLPSHLRPRSAWRLALDRAHVGCNATGSRGVMWVHTNKTRAMQATLRLHIMQLSRALSFRLEYQSTNVACHASHRRTPKRASTLAGFVASLFDTFATLISL